VKITYSPKFALPQHPADKSQKTWAQQIFCSNAPAACEALEAQGFHTREGVLNPPALRRAGFRFSAPLVFHPLPNPLPTSA